jgi:hypothetical protein
MELFDPDTRAIEHGVCFHFSQPDWLTATRRYLIDSYLRRIYLGCSLFLLVFLIYSTSK